MAFLTNLGVSNGGYPAIRLDTATITKNGVYTAPRGVAYSQVNVDVPSSGITDVNVLPDVSSFNEGDVVHLMQDDIKRTPVHLYAWRQSTRTYSRFFSIKPNPESIDDLVVVTEDGIRNFTDVYIGETITIQGTDVYCHVDGETIGPFRRQETDDIVGTVILKFVDNSGFIYYVTDDTQSDLNSRIYLYNKFTNYEYGMTNWAHIITNTASIVDERLSFDFDDGGEILSVIANHDASGDLRIGDVSGYYQGYYKVDNGIWVKIDSTVVAFTIYRHMSSSGYYMTIYGLDSTHGFGIMVRKRVDNGWKYAIWMGYNSWCDINGSGCGVNGGLNESWFDSTTEVGYGLQWLNPNTYSIEIGAFVKCPYTIIDPN